MRVNPYNGRDSLSYNDVDLTTTPKPRTYAVELT